MALAIPLAIYAGWTWLGDVAEHRELAIRMAALGAALVIGAYQFSLIFGVPPLLVGGATYALFATGRLPSIDGMFWLVFVVRLVITALPTAGVLGVGVVPAVAAFALRRAALATRLLA